MNKKNILPGIGFLLLLMLVTAGRLPAVEATGMERIPGIQVNDTVPQGIRTVSGQVVDEEGSPMPGVTVLIKGTSTGMATDVNGNFKLNVPIGKHTLRFSFMGYSPREIDSQSRILTRVVMQEVVSTIDEVVVTGYQTIDRKLFTGSASVVRADKLESDGANDISRMLQGKAAGIAIQNVSGTFGAAPKMKIRGSSSIFGEMKPLWVIDGVVLEDVVEISADELSS
ncbi:MAG: carboxypeptidase-like regulatory domain-containing protein [Odoribacteraceae bacterium]|jgi:hypothetical protein|nr:carboxypeptidase-like regulatory domain-containing protein [Odoribacteraceae bacterium]